jgi:hypothetical protein
VELECALLFHSTHFAQQLKLCDDSKFVSGAIFNELDFSGFIIIVTQTELRHSSSSNHNGRAGRVAKYLL